jgi:hypothetical protein
MMAALIELISRPEYVKPLREDVCEAIKQHGFTAAACYQMHKLDSFLKESFRMNPLVSGKLCYATSFFPFTQACLFLRICVII